MGHEVNSQGVQSGQVWTDRVRCDKGPDLLGYGMSRYLAENSVTSLDIPAIFVCVVEAESNALCCALQHLDHHS